MAGRRRGNARGRGETGAQPHHTAVSCACACRLFFVRRGDRSLTPLRVVRTPPAARPRAAARARARRVRARWVLPRRSFFFVCRAWPRRCACCRHVQPTPFALLAHAARSTSAFLPPQTFEHADTTASLGISRARACELPPPPPLLHLLPARKMAQKRKSCRARAPAALTHGTQASKTRHYNKPDTTEARAATMLGRTLTNHTREEG